MAYLKRILQSFDVAALLLLELGFLRIDQPGELTQLLATLLV